MSNGDRTLVGQVIEFFVDSAPVEASWMNTMNRPLRQRTVGCLLTAVLGISLLEGGYTNFESSHVHPIDLTPNGSRLLLVNTPDALLEVFDVLGDGSLQHATAIPVGLEPVTVRARTDGEAWVVNHLSDTISIVDLNLGLTTDTIDVGDEPTDIVFAGGKVFVAVSQEDVVKVFEVSNLAAGPTLVPILNREVRALAVSNNGQTVYAVALKSGNRTTVVNGPVAHFNLDVSDANRLSAMNLRGQTCSSGPPSYPPLHSGIVRNPLLADPPDGIPKVGLIVEWNDVSGKWEDETGGDWTPCLPYRLGDRDLFTIDVTSLATTSFTSLGTSMFDVSVHPGNGRVYIPNTEALNNVRFEHPSGVQGHMVDNRFTVLDPANSNAITIVDLNEHINRMSDPATNLAEREASISQPGMMVWKGDGTVAYLTGFGSRRLFRVAGGCLAGSCIFGTSRAAPDAVEVGEGPSGVALLEARDRLYVLNRISHSLALVEASTLTLLDTIPLHDPSSANTRFGRRFLYDAVDTSGHGDAACSSCHLSGDMDGLAWDLGDPTGTFVPYSTADDNVRFIGVGGLPCVPGQPNCAAHVGFDPQKGPMTTQTLRGMLEPLHWRGDRPTMNAFNAAFVGLMGTSDVGTPGDPRGLSTADMERFRQFALEIAFPPNPYRNLDDTLTDAEVQIHGSLYAGNPFQGADAFDNDSTDGGSSCAACHTHPFGAGGGKLGGVTPVEPTSMDAAAVFNGTNDLSLHSDLKVPHLRNMYEKFGPVWADPGDNSLPETINGFGFSHDGSIPDLFRFFSASVFTLSSLNQAQEVRDLVAFMQHFPTGTRPAVGKQITVAPGPAAPSATRTAGEEKDLATLISLGDLADGNRHCELTATTVLGGRTRSYHLSGAVWVGDVSGEVAQTTEQLRNTAEAEITFTCAPLASGPRLGGNRDEDIVLNGDDCAPGDPSTWLDPLTVLNVGLDSTVPTTLTWDEQSATAGPSMRYEVVGGGLSELRASGVGVASCVASDLPMASFDDLRSDPPEGDGYFYLIRATNPCGVSVLGPGREALDSLTCN
jgi:hypothetical protein